MNRSALKLANITALLNLPPVNSFVDLCGGPGGWTEFLFFKYLPNVSGFGITLKGPMDFKPPLHPRFKVDYGCDGTGDITRKANITSFSSKVLQQYPGL